LHGQATHLVLLLAEHQTPARSPHEIQQPSSFIYYALKRIFDQRVD